MAPGGLGDVSAPRGCPTEGRIWGISGKSHCGSGTSWGVKSVPPRVGLGHVGGQRTPHYEAGVSQGMRDVLMWVWGTLGDKGHRTMELGHLKGGGTSWYGSGTS